MRSERASEAKMHYERGLEVNPRNVEAARALRLMEMRRTKEHNAKKSFIKKLLK